MNPKQIKELVALLIWVAGEHVKKTLGLPSEWMQTRWCARVGEHITGTACGTAACLGGRYMLTHGWTFKEDPTGETDSVWTKVSKSTRETKTLPVNKTGTYVAKQLGILTMSPYGNDIFDADNDFESIMLMAECLINA